MMMVWTFSACGPLPRPGALSADLGVLPVSDDLTGLVMASVDGSYSSTDLYFYNLANGHLELMVGGESGDVLTRWHGGQLWIFNRASGRVSYSAMSPKVGVMSRSVERRTPDADANDPADVLWLNQNVSVLAMQSSHQVVTTDLTSGDGDTSLLKDVDTQDTAVPFRPGLLAFAGADLAVFHQSLNANWQAVGGGLVYLARQDDFAQLSWVDQNVAVSGVQGLRLNVSNPVQTLGCSREDNQCMVAGSCFESMGSACVGGVDAVNWEQRSVTNRLIWPAGSYGAGQIAQGFSSGDVVACLRLAGESHARLTLFDLASGSMISSFDTGAPWCGPFIVDRSGKRIFLIQKIGADPFFMQLSASLAEQSRKRLGFDVLSVEAVDE